MKLWIHAASCGKMLAESGVHATGLAEHNVFLGLRRRGSRPGAQGMGGTIIQQVERKTYGKARQVCELAGVMVFGVYEATVEEVSKRWLF